MNWIERFRTIVHKNRRDREIDEELQFHLEHQIELNIAAGMGPDEARCAALREFGGVGEIKEECRSSRGMDWLDSLFADIRYAARNFRRKPAFALTVIGVTAIGIGATTAVFSVVDRVLFRPLPYRQPERLVSLGMSAPVLPFDFLTGDFYIGMRRDPAPLEAVTSWSGMVDCNLTENHPLRLGCARAESSFLPLLGVQPVAGRNFTPDEDRPNAPGVALISYNLWKTRFGGRQDALGQRISLDGQPTMVVGVLPADFELPELERADVLMPQGLPPSVQPGYRPLRVYGRLRRGMSIVQIRAAMGPFAAKLTAAAPPQFRKEIRFRVQSLHDLRTGDLRVASWTLFAAVLAMLLIACANAANLLLARSMARQRELALRAALGAGRSRLARQALTESLLLSLTGGLAGCLLAAVLLRIFVLIAPAGVPHLASAELDLRVLLFAFAASLCCGLVFGLAPALRTPRAGMLTGARITGSSSMVARHILVGAQLAVSLALLTSAGLLLQSLWQRQGMSLGIRTDHIVTASIALGPKYPQPQARSAFYDGLEARLLRLPGVEAVGYSDSLPPGGSFRGTPYFYLQADNAAPAENGTGGMVTWRPVTPGYFRALGIRLLRGRLFTEEDRSPTAHSIILSESLARRLFAGQDPIQKQMKRFRGNPRGPSPWYTVVGVTADVHNGGLSDRNNPEYYIARRYGAPEYDDAPGNSLLLVRGSASAKALQSWVRTEIAAADRTLPVAIRSFDDHVGELAARPRFQALLLALFAGIGLLLAASGLYGLIAFLVAQREREIGVRLSLGATPAQIRWMILGHALRWTAGGVAAGVAGSAFAAWSLRSLLFHVSAADPIAFGGAALLLVALALLAALAPSHRAASLDPMITLRQD